MWYGELDSYDDYAYMNGIMKKLDSIHYYKFNINNIKIDILNIKRVTEMKILYKKSYWNENRVANIYNI